MKLLPVILSGGSGTRLWPLSREYFPKQLLPLHNEYSLLQNTVLRLEDLGSDSSGAIEILSPLLVCNEEHRFLVAEQMRQIGCGSAEIILEPIGRNTAPALTAAAFETVKQYQDAVLLVMPADHVINNVPSFHQAVNSGYQAALKGALVTFGIVPSHAETGYGYIKKSVETYAGAEGCSLISAFVEKPDLETAERYVSSGEYLWNSGMFMMKASQWLKATESYCPDIKQACKASVDHGKVDNDFFRLDKQAFSECPSDSIDYAVMEKLTDSSSSDIQGVVVSLDAGWSDVGAWSALLDISEKDESGNVLKGDVYTFDTANSLALSDSRMLALVGVEDIIVVETPDAVLVAHRDHSQDIKKVVNKLKDEDRTLHQYHQKVFRPWGNYEGIDMGDRFQVKRITVNPGEALSLQMHHHRAEHWIVVQGTAQVTRGDETFLVSENESTYIPIGVKHRLENPGKLPLELIEVQSGAYLGEDDIVRFEDVYGREEKG